MKKKEITDEEINCILMEVKSSEEQKKLTEPEKKEIFTKPVVVSHEEIFTRLVYICPLCETGTRGNQFKCPDCGCTGDFITAEEYAEVIKEELIYTPQGIMEDLKLIKLKKELTEDEIKQELKIIKWKGQWCGGLFRKHKQEKQEEKEQGEQEEKEQGEQELSFSDIFFSGWVLFFFFIVMLLIGVLIDANR